VGSVFEIVRDSPSVSMTTGLVIAAMGLVAIALSYALALYTFEARDRVLQLPGVVLVVASVFFAGVSMGAFWLAWQRRRGRDA
jgi:hypothetical protein